MIDENVVNRGPSMKEKSSKSKGKTVEEIYTKKTQLEHILLRPDTYIGSIEKQTQNLWVVDPDSNRIVNRSVTFVPGLYKIFDEIIVNAADNKQRDPSMNRIEVNINQQEGFIRVWNNGAGIPVQIHSEHQVYVPELIFGHLLTGSNFDDEEAKTTGGRNGYGSKLANIFSSKFIVETCDTSSGRKYKQEFTNNMSSKSAPIVAAASGSDYTCITFYPDLKRFKMDSLDNDIIALLSKRVYDMAGTIISNGARMNVYLNGTKIDARSFEQYIGLYNEIQPVIFEKVNDRWEIGVGVSDGTFQQISFVNSISTIKGGCHVNYIADQITTKLMAIVKKRNKGVEMKPFQIKNHLAVYVNALIVNPAFDSQTKENLTTKSSSFGSTCAISDKMMKAIEKSGIIENILNWAKFKQTAELKKKSGSKKNKILGISKLDDANYAGTAKSRDCSLILTEGDSAKTLAISGLSIVGRDYYGVFPLKGKLLNVREASHAQIMKNEEIQNIVTILGLSFGKEYSDTSSLRYGHLLIMTDQDHDGSHIKGLLINFIHHFWPSLLKVDGFLQQFITPIVKCLRHRQEIVFFTIPEYQSWKMNNNDGKGWKIKYYKGLGTSTAVEAKEYFSDLNTHVINFEWDEQANDMIDMAFAKKRVDDRKYWLLGNEAGTYMDYKTDAISYNDFVNKELILFSAADNERSIPHYLDGLKPSQRKVLYSCFKRNLRQEVKVAQLAGYVSEHSAYHHGEASLTQTIIGMAQNYVGSNNINLLSPCGQFGTRLMGGKDAASPRYVFTKLERITRTIFHPLDDPLLTYLDEDGQSIEPSYYVPVIPMVLVNGAEGIGTGWSTSVTTYNPRDIINCLREMIANKQGTELHPWYRGFTGEIQIKGGGNILTPSYIVSGRVEVVDDSTIVISELPIGKWTSDYKQFLESMLIGAPVNKEKDSKDKDEGHHAVTPIIKDFKENHTDTTVLFTITIPSEKLSEIINEKGGLQKRFKLDVSISTTNMNLFDNNSVIKKFDGPMEVVNAFYGVRIELYGKRKNHLLNKLTEEWEKLDNKVRFIQAVIDGRIIVSNRKKADLLNDLLKHKFKFFNETKSLNPIEPSESNDSDRESTNSTEVTKSNSSQLELGYDYLLSMKIWSLTLEKIQELSKERDDKNKEIQILTNKTPEDLWLEDLDSIESELDKFEESIEKENAVEAKYRLTAQKSRAGKNKGKPRQISKQKGNDDDDSMEIDSNDESDFENHPKKPKHQAKKPAVVPAPSRSVLLESAVTKSSTALSNAKVAAAKPITKAASGSVAVLKQSSKSTQPKTVDLLDDDEDADMKEDSKPLTFMERLKLKQTASTSSKPDGKLIAKSAKALDDNNDDIFNVDSLKPTAKASVRATQRPVKKAVYSIDSEDSIVNDDDDFEDDDFSEVGSDFSDEKPSKQKTKTIPVKKQPVSQVVEVGNVKPSKGVKRQKKDTSSKSNDLLSFSPDKMVSPEAKKKQRKMATKASDDLDIAGNDIAKPKTVKAKSAQATSKASAPAKTKTIAKPKKVDSDSEEVDFDSPVKSRTPKPSRSRKPATYANYYEESEEDSFIVPDDEDEYESDE